jgi:hypothetical protein
LNSEKSQAHLNSSNDYRRCFGWTTNYSDTGQHFWISAYLMLNLLPHEMIHVAQKRLKTLFMIKRERILVRNVSFHEHNTSSWTLYFTNAFFANKALEYYNRMGSHTANKIRKSKQKSRHYCKITKKVVCTINSFNNKINLK